MNCLEAEPKFVSLAPNRRAASMLWKEALHSCYRDYTVKVREPGIFVWKNVNHFSEPVREVVYYSANRSLEIIISTESLQKCSSRF